MTIYTPVATDEKDTSKTIYNNGIIPTDQTSNIHPASIIPSIVSPPPPPVGATTPTNINLSFNTPLPERSWSKFATQDGPNAFQSVSGSACGNLTSNFGSFCPIIIVIIGVVLGCLYLAPAIQGLFNFGDDVYTDGTAVVNGVLVTGEDIARDGLGVIHDVENFAVKIWDEVNCALWGTDCGTHNVGVFCCSDWNAAGIAILVQHGTPITKICARPGQPATYIANKLLGGCCMGYQTTCPRTSFDNRIGWQPPAVVNPGCHFGYYLQPDGSYKWIVSIDQFTAAPDINHIISYLNKDAHKNFITFNPPIDACDKRINWVVNGKVDATS